MSVVWAIILHSKLRLYPALLDLYLTKDHHKLLYCLIYNSEWLFPHFFSQPVLFRRPEIQVWTARDGQAWFWRVERMIDKSVSMVSSVINKAATAC